MPMTLSIRIRLTLLYSGLLFVSLILFGASATWLLRHRLTERVHESLAKEISGFKDHLRRETTAKSRAEHIQREIAEYAGFQPEGNLMAVWDRVGNVLLQSKPAPIPSITQEEIFIINGQMYRVRAAAALAPVEASLSELRWLLTALAPILLLLTGAVGYWISSRALAPVDGMTRAARSIGLDDLSRRVAVPSSSDELSRLAEAWNEMLARLEDSVARIQRFTADAAHELRTPLTALRTTAELAVRRQRESSEYRESLQQVVNISKRMSNLVDELLTLARGDTATAGKGLGIVDLTAVARSVCHEMQPLFASKGVELAVNLTEQAPAGGDMAGLKRLLTSLVENALKYTAATGRVNVSVRQQGSEQVMEVADTGCGIPPELLPHIFDRFYRVDSSRDRRSGGYGLGLAIAQQIAQFHNSEIEVESVAGKGSCFRLRLAMRTAGVEAGPQVLTHVPSKA